MITLDTLNAAPPADFAATLAPIFEHAAFVATDCVALRPFPSLTALHAAMVAVLAALPPDRQLAFLNGHPQLSPRSLRQAMTADSTAEQSAAGIGALDAATADRLDAMNALYQARFGFPFILAIRQASPATLLAAFSRRLLAGPEAERAEALAEIAAIGWLRLLARIQPAPTGSLSTHVLDTVRACPAAGLGVALYRCEAAAKIHLMSFTTNANGASERHLLGGGQLRAGAYEWVYDTPSYFAAHGRPTAERAFLGQVVVGFSVWNPEQHFHVPLLLTPGSYTVYRGS